MRQRSGPYKIDRDTVVRLWLHRQGLSAPGAARLTRKTFVDHLERTGGLQLDSVNAVDRAHYLTLLSRFGPYDRVLPDRWTYRDRAAYEYRSHEASILPPSRLPVSRRAMRRFDVYDSWWARRRPSPAAIRRVLGRIRREGPLESADFKTETERSGPWWGWKADKMALEILWFQGRLAIDRRTHFRRVYDLAERVYPEGPAASVTEFEDSWLLYGLSGNGIASERHLEGYITSPRLRAADRRKVIARNLRRGRIVEVDVDGMKEPYFARPRDLEVTSRLGATQGTAILCPFDSFLWQRRRAEDLLGFRYRIEIYVPAGKRRYGYYVMPVLYDGRLVARIDPKYHRDRAELEIRAVHPEPGFRKDAAFVSGLSGALGDMARFLGAGKISAPRAWRALESG